VFNNIKIYFEILLLLVGLSKYYSVWATGVPLKLSINLVERLFGIGNGVAVEAFYIAVFFSYLSLLVRKTRGLGHALS